MKTINECGVLINPELGIPNYSEMIQQYGIEIAQALTVKWSAYDAMTSGANGLLANKQNAYALRLARLNGDERLVMTIIKRKRKGRHVNAIMTQRRWQAKVSRRPARGRHHDSWGIREKYVTGKES